MDLEQEYRKYRDRVYDEPLGNDQDQELRKAFFAGCVVVFGGLMDATDGPDTPETEEKAFEELQSIQDQLDRFRDMVMANEL